MEQDGTSLEDLWEMIKLIGTCLGVIGCISIALYVGAWFCFVGGIRQMVEGIKSVPVDGVQISLGLLRFFVAAPMGWVTFFLGLALVSLLGLFDEKRG